MIVLLSAMALGIYVGFDPVGSKDVVQGTMKVDFNTSIFNNANDRTLVVPATSLYISCLYGKGPILLRS